MLQAHRSRLYQRLVIAGFSHQFVSILYLGLAGCGVGLAASWLRGEMLADVVTPVGLAVDAGGLWVFVRVVEKRHEHASSVVSPATAPDRAGVWCRRGLQAAGGRWLFYGERRCPPYAARAEAHGYKMSQRTARPAMTADLIRERPHRLPRDAYRGEVAVAFTVCVQDRVHLFEDACVVDAFIELLAAACAGHDCVVPVYCFMPDHVHIMTLGQAARADGWSTVVDFKQRTGFWLAKNRQPVRWQRNFHDHVLRKDEDLAAHARYVADNPVRRGLVSEWAAYPHTGSIGVELGDVLVSAIELERRGLP